MIATKMNDFIHPLQLSSELMYNLDIIIYLYLKDQRNCNYHFIHTVALLEIFSSVIR